MHTLSKKHRKNRKIMKKKKNGNIFIVILLVVVCSCNNNKVAYNNKVSTEQTNIKTNNIPYKIANNYFVNNDVDGNVPTKITNEKDFEKYFGMATVMGKDGQPTEINFNNEFVISVVKPQTDYSTILSPISLNKDNKGKIIFTYNINKGKKQSYDIVPFLLVIVNKKYEAQVIIKEKN